MNRRDFLLKGGAAAAGLSVVRAPDGMGAAGVFASEPAASVALPPPFGKATYITRMESARALMRQLKADVLIETPGKNLTYLTGLALHRSERLIALVLPLSDPPVLLGPMFERDLLAGSPGVIEDIRTWEEQEDPFEHLEKILRKAGLSDKKVCIGATTWYDDLVHLQILLPKLTFLSTSAVVGYLRERKGPEEIAFMQAAVDITERAISASLAELKEGMREDELSSLIVARMAAMGVRGDGLVQFGPRSAVPHNPTSDRRLAAGDMVLVDFGAEVNGYWSDISRPAVFGKATGRMKLVHDTIRLAQDSALARARPNEPCDALDMVARAAIGGKGFFKFLLHRLGHGIGLDGHEPPWLSLGNSVKLAIGNVATLEPGIYTPGDYGMRIEDMMEVTEHGGRLLSHPPARLLEI